MKPKIIPLLEQCISTGTQLGWNRAHKHNDNPGELVVFQEIETAIMNEIYEWFNFEELERYE